MASDLNWALQEVTKSMDDFNSTAEWFPQIGEAALSSKGTKTGTSSISMSSCPCHPSDMPVINLEKNFELNRN